jgi:hypothetical protein
VYTGGLSVSAIVSDAFVIAHSSGGIFTGIFSDAMSLGSWVLKGSQNKASENEVNTVEGNRSDQGTARLKILLPFDDDRLEANSDDDLSITGDDYFEYSSSDGDYSP